MDLYPDEFQQFKKGVRIKREQQRTKFGETNLDYAERIIHEVPATLFAMLKVRLSEEDMAWLWSEDDKSKEGVRWFAKTFKDFQVTEKV